MNLRNLIPSLLIPVVLLVSLGGCQSSITSPIELVPQDADFIANVNLSGIIDDPDFQKAYNEASKPTDQPQTIDEALDRVIDETGIDLRDFTGCLIFGDVAELEQGDYIGIIIEGNLNEATFVGNLEARSKKTFTSSDYKGIKLYTDDNEEMSLSFLSNQMLLLGSPRAVSDAIDVSKGERSQISGQVLETYNRLGDGLIKAAFRIPEEARQRLAEQQSSVAPFSVSSFADTDLAGFSFAKQADDITLHIEAHFVSSASAQDARDTLAGVISLLKGMSQDDGVKNLLGAIQLTAKDSLLSLELKTTLTELEKLADTFQE